MSLLNQASPFTTENSSSKKEKWVPKMMDTFKRITSEMEKSSTEKPSMDRLSTMENMTTEQDTRKKKIDDMIKNMGNTNTNTNMDSSSSDGLADYHSNVNEEEYSKVAKNPSPAPTKTRGSPLSKSYGPTPYYQGLSSTTPTQRKKTTGSEEFTPDSSSNQLMEKLNYMIHLLEEQQKESTQNIPEEFALYSLLGIFIIYIVDSFTRAGKYIR